MKLETKRGNPVKFRHRHPYLVGLTKLGIVVVSSATIFGLAYVRDVTKEPINLTTKMLTTPTVTSVMYDNQGKEIWRNNVYSQRYVEYKDIPTEYINFLLDTEDAEFYQEEYGFNVKALLSAFKSWALRKLGKDVPLRGGSTIEQQLIKLSTDGLNDRTIKRKIQEIETAYRLDKTYGKNKILELYVNKIELGENSIGVGTVAHTYYGQSLSDIAKDKSPKGMSKLAIIAGLGQAPSECNLYDNPKKVEKRRKDVIQSAYDRGHLTKKQVKDILAVPVTEGLKERYWQNNELINSTINHNGFVTATLEELSEQGYNPYKQSMEIHTTLDSDKDSEVKEIMEDDSVYQPEDTSIGRVDLQQSASTTIDVKTGKVVAQFGGRKQKEALGLNRATQTTRSSGSIIKPFLSYAPAIEYMGHGSGTALDSSNYKYKGTNFVAGNYGGYQYGIVSMSKALRLSLNTPAIRELDDVVGSDRAKVMMKNLGMDVKENYGGSDALGLDVSTQQIANGMSTLANFGQYQKASHINFIITKSGKIEFNYPKTQAMHDSTAYILLSMMQGVTKEGGSAPEADIPEYIGYASKTGTVGYDDSDGIDRPEWVASDTWIGGTTKNYAIAIWTGYDSPNKQGNWVDKEDKAKTKLYLSLTKFFNNGLDVSNWGKPNTVRGSGDSIFPTSLYEPVDTFKNLTEKSEEKRNPVASPKIEGGKIDPNLESDWEKEKMKGKIQSVEEYINENKIYAGD